MFDLNSILDDTIGYNLGYNSSKIILYILSLKCELFIRDVINQNESEFANIHF